jgi:Spy/CpxP family protein refolding chaperone
MKTIICTFIGITLITFFLSAVSAMAFRCGAGGGMGGCGWCGSGPNSLSLYEVPNLTAEQSEKLAQFQKAHIEETSALRTELAVKKIELNQLLAKPQPLKDPALQLQKEISNLKSQLQQKCLSRQIEMRSILTDEQRTQLAYGPGPRSNASSGWMRGNGAPRGQGCGPGSPGGFRSQGGGCGSCCR